MSVRFDTRAVDFVYQAGQFLRLTLAGVANDPRGPSRFFSLASSPSERDSIMIATRISENPFKKALAALSVGQSVTVEGPFGRFTLAQPGKLHVFLSGGIGITPFRSILKFATDQKLPHKITLLYSNQTPENIVFKEDLDQFAKANPHLTIVHTITRGNSLPADQSLREPSTNSSEKASGKMRRGRIDEAMIKEYVNDIANAVFYIAGPPSMVEALSAVVKGMGVSEEHIKTERFTGYP